MRLLIAIAMAALLSACSAPTTPAINPAPRPAPDASGKITVPAGANVAIDAPKSGAVVIDLRKEDAGKTISVKVGQRISVSLVGVPTAGYIWAASTPPAFLQLAGQSSGPTHSDQLKPGFAGGNHWEVTTYEVTKPGKGVLMFEQRRPWETKEPPTDTWSVTIDAK